MPHTHKEYSSREIAISASTHELHRKQYGDIICVRQPYGYIGSAEAHTYIWLLVNGEDTNLLDRLADPLYEYYADQYEPIYYTDSTENTIIDKRRFCVPLHRLAERVSKFDPEKARNPALLYQPFLPVETDTYYFRIHQEENGEHGLDYLPESAIAYPPLNIHGLVYDKRYQRYI